MRVIQQNARNVASVSIGYWRELMGTIETIHFADLIQHIVVQRLNICSKKIPFSLCWKGDLLLCC